MTGAMYAAIGGLRSHMSKLNVIGNNLANVNTYGYKSQRMTFRESIYGTTRSGSNGGITNGGNNPSQTGYGCTVATIDLNMSPSTYAPTGINMDCYIDGDGFFLLGGKLTAEEVYNREDGSLESVKWTGGVTSGNQLKDFTLSRVGDFWIDPDGYVCNGDGLIVYGFARVQNPYYVPDATKAQIEIAKLDGYDIESETIISTQLVPLRVPLQAAAPTKQNGGVVTRYVTNANGEYLDANGKVLTTGEGDDAKPWTEADLATLTEEQKAQIATEDVNLWEEGDPVYPFLDDELEIDGSRLNQYADPSLTKNASTTTTTGEGADAVTTTTPGTKRNEKPQPKPKDPPTGGGAADEKTEYDYTNTYGYSQTAVAENTAADAVSNVMPCQLRNISIGTDGAITATANGKTVTVGYIALATADNPNGVTHVGGPYYQCLPGAGNMRVSTCGVQMPGGYLGNKEDAQGIDRIWNEPATQYQSQGLEASSTDVAYEFAELVTTQRGYQANTRIVSVTDSMLEELVNMKR